MVCKVLGYYGLLDPNGGWQNLSEVQGLLNFSWTSDEEVSFVTPCTDEKETYQTVAFELSDGRRSAERGERCERWDDVGRGQISKARQAEAQVFVADRCLDPLQSSNGEPLVLINGLCKVQLPFFWSSVAGGLVLTACFGLHSRARAALFAPAEAESGRVQGFGAPVNSPCTRSSILRRAHVSTAARTGEFSGYVAQCMEPSGRCLGWDRANLASKCGDAYFGDFCALCAPGYWCHNYIGRQLHRAMTT